MEIKGICFRVFGLNISSRVCNLFLPLQNDLGSQMLFRVHVTDYGLVNELENLEHKAHKIMPNSFIDLLNKKKENEQFK